MNGTLHLYLQLIIIQNIFFNSVIIFIDRKKFAKWISEDKTKSKDEGCRERKKRDTRMRS